MMRKLFTLAAAASALLCAGAAVLWVRSYYYAAGEVAGYGQLIRLQTKSGPTAVLRVDEVGCEQGHLSSLTYIEEAPPPGKFRGGLVLSGGGRPPL